MRRYAKPKLACKIKSPYYCFSRDKKLKQMKDKITINLLRPNLFIHFTRSILLNAMQSALLFTVNIS